MPPLLRRACSTQHVQFCDVQRLRLGVMTDQDFEIPRDILEGWAGVAHTARLMIDVLQQIREPKPGSNLAQVNEVYAPERGSDWCRSYLSSALEHLEFWGDHVAPLKFHPEQRVRHTFRPVQTLSRAAIESSAHAIWVLDARTAQECTRRHLSLVVHDFEEQKKAAVGQERKTALARRREDLISRIGPDFSEDDVKRAPGYMDLVKQAAAVVAAKGSATYDIDTVERLWRASAGSAHGKRWPSYELQIVLPQDEVLPGQFNTVQMPDPSAITSVTGLASSLTSYAVLRFADYSGYEPQLASILGQARDRLSAKITRRTDL